MAFQNQEQYFHAEDQQWEKHHVRKPVKHSFKEGQLVLVERMSKTGENAPKLSKLPAVLGPARITKLIGDKTVELEYLVNGEIRQRSYKHLRPYFSPSKVTGYEKYFNGPKDKRKIHKSPIDSLMDEGNDTSDYNESNFEWNAQTKKDEIDNEASDDETFEEGNDSGQQKPNTSNYDDDDDEAEEKKVTFGPNQILNSIEVTPANTDVLPISPRNKSSRKKNSFIEWLQKIF